MSIESRIAGVLPQVPSISLSTLALWGGTFVSSYIVLRVLIIALNKVLRYFSAKTKTKLDDMLIAALQNPIHYFAILTSSYFAFFISTPDIKVSTYGLEDTFIIFYLVLFAHAISNVFGAIVAWYGRESSPRVKNRINIREEVFPIIGKSISLIIYVIAAVLILGKLGIELAPVLAGLGIAGLAVALALQDSLSNFFAGIYLLADRPVRVGDYIELETPNQGFVQGYIYEIGWRSTRIRTPQNNIIVIPNAKLGQNTIINFSLPTKWRSIAVEVGVDYSSDPEHVERVLLEVGKEVLTRTPGGIKDSTPLVRFADFGESSLKFKLIVRVDVEEYGTQFLVGHELRKEIVKRFRKEKITIPFPIRTLYMADSQKKPNV
ncbi:MAG: mechanosensitive ion channel family protein [Candidatus Micrarchaeota archaeon]